MQVRVEQLPDEIERKGLSPVYLISGDEPLQLNEASDFFVSFPDFCALAEAETNPTAVQIAQYPRICRNFVAVIFIFMVSVSCFMGSRPRGRRGT